jgi:nicotinate phosphoribosyltransferase
MAGDIVTLEGDVLDGEALLLPVMRGGRRLGPAAPLADLRARAAAQLARLPDALRRLTPREAYPVEISPSIRELARQVDAQGSGSG